MAQQPLLKRSAAGVAATLIVPVPSVSPLVPSCRLIAPLLSLIALPSRHPPRATLPRDAQARSTILSGLDERLQGKRGAQTQGSPSRDRPGIQSATPAPAQREALRRRRTSHRALAGQVRPCCRTCRLQRVVQSARAALDQDARLGPCLCTAAQRRHAWCRGRRAPHRTSAVGCTFVLWRHVYVCLWAACAPARQTNSRDWTCPVRSAASATQACPRRPPIASVQARCQSKET